MIWLAQEIWLWMVLAALAGAVLTGFFATKEIKVERWVPSPVPESETESHVDVTSNATSAPPRHEEPASPFPELHPVSGPRSWEDEELWSRPAAPAPGVAAERADRETTDPDWQSRPGETSPGAGAVAPRVAEPPLAVTPVEPVTEPVAQPVAQPAAERLEVPVAELEPAPDPFPVPITRRRRRAAVKATQPVVVEPATPIAEGELEIIPGLLEVVEIVEPEDETDTRAADEPGTVETPTVETPTVETPTVERAAVEPVDVEPAAVGQPDDEEPEQVAVPEAAPELTAAEKIRAELARLEAELAKREARKQELLAAERLETERRTTEPGAVADAVSEVDTREVRTPEEAQAQDVDPRADAERAEAERLEVERAARARARAQKAAATRARKKAEREEAERLATEQAQTARRGAERKHDAADKTTAKRASRARSRGAEAKRAEVVPLDRGQGDSRRRLEGDLAPVDAPISLAAWVGPRETDDDGKHGPFGPGSANPMVDGSAPRGFPVKGTMATRLYHAPRSRFYSRTQADVWFETEEHAEAAGFIRWDRRGSSAHLALDLDRDQAAQG